MRFIVPVFVVVSYLAAQALLQPEIDRHSGELSAISEEVSIDGQQVLDELAVAENGPENQDGDIQATEEQGSWLDRFRTATDRTRAAVDRILPDIGLPDLSILPALLDHAVQLAEYLTRLLVLIAVKNILLPLVFLALALKVIRPVAHAHLLAMTSAIDRDLKDIKQTAKEIGSEGSSALPKP